MNRFLVSILLASTLALKVSSTVCEPLDYFQLRKLSDNLAEKHKDLSYHHIGRVYFDFLIDELSTNWGLGEQEISQILEQLENEVKKNPTKEIVQTTYNRLVIEAGLKQYYIKPIRSQIENKKTAAPSKPTQTTLVIPDEDSNDFDTYIDSETNKGEQKIDTESLAREFKSLTADRDSFDLLVALLSNDYKLDEAAIRKVLQDMSQIKTTKKTSKKG
jgi:hypothetical protein